MNSPIICFGQQPCGFFPKRFLVAKINTVRKLQAEIGGRIIFFYHDSDADYRETISILSDRQTKAEVRLNFTQENKLQKKFSPLYLKRIPVGWKEEILKQLPRFIAEPPSPLEGEGRGEGAESLIAIFKSVNANTVADFCLKMYQKMGLLDGIEIVRSSDKNFREKAPELNKEYFADIQYQGEIVRAQFLDGKFQLHEGGGKYLELPTPEKVEKWQKNPARDERFGWMQSVIGCTHYVAGNDEYEYIDKNKFPEVAFVKREQITEQNFAYLG